MRAVIQRVSQAGVSARNGSYRESIGAGFAVLLGVAAGDSDEDCRYLARKIAGLRVFEDEEGKMNLSIKQTGGQVLLIPQFTLCSDCSKGQRPSFTEAAPPEKAACLYKRAVSLLQEEKLEVKTGVFGSHMLVSISNDGPVTFVIDSKKGSNKPG